MHRQRHHYGANYLHFIAANSYRRARQRRAVAVALVGRYVLMPDHVHLFAVFRPRTITLSAWMKSLKNSLSKALRAMGKIPPHWEDGFFDHVLRSSESYEQKWLYVRGNPVRAGLVTRAEDWPYQGEIHPLQL